MRQKIIFDDPSGPFSFFIQNKVIEGTEKNEKENKIHLLYFLKVCWYRTYILDSAQPTSTPCSRPFVYKNTMFKTLGIV